MNLFRKQLIEELMYRRNYSPYVSKASSYLEALERDEMVNNLRRQYSNFKCLESEYDDLRYQIGKAERENKKLQEKNTEIQENYLQKIKGNKTLISELTYQIDDEKKLLENVIAQISNKETSNQNLIKDIKKNKCRIENTEQTAKDYDRYIFQQENVILDLQNSLMDLERKKKQIQEGNKLKSTQIDEEFQMYKDSEEKLKMEQLQKLELKKDLSQLKQKKQKLEKKTKHNEVKVKQFSKKYDLCEFQSEKLCSKAQQLEKEMGKTFADSLSLKQSMKKSLSKNKQSTERLKVLEVLLKENVNELYSKKIKKEHMLGQLADLMKSIEKTQSTIEIINSQIAQQEDNHNGLVTNLRKSIRNDEEAVKTLTRKAAILNMISH